MGTMATAPGPATTMVGGTARKLAGKARWPSSEVKVGVGEPGLGI